MYLLLEPEIPAIHDNILLHGTVQLSKHLQYRAYSAAQRESGQDLEMCLPRSFVGYDFFFFHDVSVLYGIKFIFVIQESADQVDAHFYAHIILGGKSRNRAHETELA